MKIAYIVENYGISGETLVTDLVTALGKLDGYGDIITDRIFEKCNSGFNIVETGFSSGRAQLAILGGRVGTL